MAQLNDSLNYDPKMIGTWELHSYIIIYSQDTFQIHQETAYWNTFVRIEVDSVQEILIPTGKSNDLPNFDTTCKWSIYKEEGQTWITIPCGNYIRGEHKIDFVSGTELHTICAWHEEPVKLLFRKID